MKIPRLFLLLALLPIASAQEILKDQPKRSDVIFELLWNDGKPLELTLEIDSQDGRQLYREKVRSQAIVPLPYGSYLVKYEGDGFASATRRLTVDRLDQLVVFTEFLEDYRIIVEPPPPGGITMKVHPMKSCTPNGTLWAKLVAVYSDYSQERKLSSYGFALFEPVNHGTYVLMIVDRDRVRATRVVSTIANLTSLDIALEDCE
jgi:hypothetical protein